MQLIKIEKNIIKIFSLYILTSVQPKNYFCNINKFIAINETRKTGKSLKVIAIALNVN